MAETLHFEELWEKCENIHKTLNTDDSVVSIIEELVMKINLYKAIDARPEIPEEERNKIKLRALCEILFTFTNLSFKDNLNVFEALNVAQQYRQLELDSKIPPDLRLPGKR